MDSPKYDKLQKIAAIGGFSFLAIYVVYSQFVAPKPPEKPVKVETVREAKATKADPDTASKVSSRAVPVATEKPPEKGPMPPHEVEYVEPEPTPPTPAPQVEPTPEIPPPTITEHPPAKPRTLENLTALDLQYIDGWTPSLGEAFLLHRASLGRPITWNDVLQVQGMTALAAENLKLWLQGA